MPAYYLNKEYMNQIIGKGMSMEEPFILDTRDAKWKVNCVSGEDKINDSIRNILSTRVGERFFMPEFGSRLHLCLFEPNSLICRDLIVHYTKEALSNWEKRIVVDKVTVSDIDDSNDVYISIYYHFTNSNIYGSFVYPFNMSVDGELDYYKVMGSQ